MVLSELKISFSNLEFTLVGQKFPFWIVMEMHWKWYAVSRVSPLMSVNLFPMSWISSVASAFHDPWSTRLDRYSYEDVGIGDVRAFFLLGDGGIVCCCSCNSVEAKWNGAVKREWSCLWHDKNIETLRSMMPCMIIALLLIDYTLISSLHTVVDFGVIGMRFLTYTLHMRFSRHATTLHFVRTKHPFFVCSSWVNCNLLLG